MREWRLLLRLRRLRPVAARRRFKSNPRDRFPSVPPEVLEDHEGELGRLAAALVREPGARAAGLPRPLHELLRGRVEVRAVAPYAGWGLTLVLLFTCLSRALLC